MRHSQKITYSSFKCIVNGHSADSFWGLIMPPTELTERVLLTLNYLKWWWISKIGLFLRIFFFSLLVGQICYTCHTTRPELENPSSTLNYRLWGTSSFTESPWAQSSNAWCTKRELLEEEWSVPLVHFPLHKSSQLQKNIGTEVTL